MKTPFQTSRLGPTPHTKGFSETPAIRPPSGRAAKRPIALTLAVALVGGLIGASVTFAWHRADVRDRDRLLTAAIAARDEAREGIAALLDRVDGLKGRLTAAKARAGDLETELADTEAELLAIVGPALPDGEHFGAIYAVGVAQEPPRLVIDIEQWFTDQAATDAAIEDGITVDPGINGYYIRNENPRWRTVEIDPAAKVSLTTYPYADPAEPKVVSLGRFGDLFYSYQGYLLQTSPYWITVKDGRVLAIEEQFLP